jgi:hypothetical protein
MMALVNEDILRVISVQYSPFQSDIFFLASGYDVKLMSGADLNTKTSFLSLAYATISHHHLF